MGKEEDAKKQLTEIVDARIKPLMARYKKVYPQLKTAHVKLVSATSKHDAPLIDFESRGLRAFTRELGEIVSDTGEVLGILDEYAEDPDLAGARDDAGKWVQGLSGGRRKVAQYLKKADQLLAHADRALREAVKHGGNLEAAWAAVRAKVAEDKKMLDALSSSMDGFERDARAAAKALDGGKLDDARQQASGVDGMAEQWIQDATSTLAQFDKEMSKGSPSRDFMTVYETEHKKLAETIDDMRFIAKEIRKQYVDISVLEVQFNFVKVAQAMGIPVDEAKKLAPAFAQNDAAKLKAIGAAAKKHKIDVPPKELLATLRKRGLVGHA